MKNLLFLLVGVAALTAIATILVPTPTADAGTCEKCFGFINGTTDPHWGFGSTCSAATSDAIAQASADVPCSDSCQEIVVSLDPCGTDCSNPGTCFDPYGQWRVDVEIDYECPENICL